MSPLEAQSESQPPRWVELLPLVAAGVLFARTLGFEFLDYDDPMMVSQNPLVQQPSWEGVWRIVSAPLLGDYQPLYLLTFMVEWQLGGGAAWLFHGTNAALHGVTAVLVGRLLTPAIGARRAVLAAVLFAVHPLAVEPVAWIASRKDVLMLPLLLGSVLCYRRGVAGERLRWGWLAGALALECLAMLSKSAAVVLPALVLWDRVLVNPSGRLRLPPRREWPPLLALGAGALLGVWLKLYALAHVGAAASLPPEGIAGRIEAVVLSLGAFLEHLLWPVALHLAYDPGELNGLERAVAWAAVALGPLALALVASKRRDLVYCAGWWVIALLPSAQLLTYQIWVADRYAYAALAGGAGLVVAAVLGGKGGATNRRVALAVVVGAACFLSGRQLQRWRDSQTLWTTTVARHPRNRVAVPNLARILAQRGRANEARALLERARRDQPDNYRLGWQLGSILLAAGETAAAEAVLREEPPNAVFVRVLRAQGRSEEARRALDRALEARPKAHALRALRGAWALERGQPAEARADLEVAVRSDPTRPRTWVDLAKARARGGDAAGAAEALAWARRVGLAEVVALVEGARLHALAGAREQALAALAAALRAEPGLARVLAADPELGPLIAEASRR